MTELMEAALWARSKADDAEDAVNQWQIDNKGIRPSLLEALDRKSRRLRLLSETALKAAHHGE